jgi:manganese/iron transport system permease protein/iron/zinc/copper transport system permease protein
MDTLLEPFGYAFFRNAIAVATLAGALCGLVGVYVVLRGMSYIGHGLSHAIFGGAVVSYVINVNFYVGASLWGFLSALLINLTVRRRPVIGADAAIGIVTTASFAVGVALISQQRTFTRSFEAALFGNILGVEPADLLAIALVTTLTAVVCALAYRRLLFVTFDPEVAGFFGIHVQRIDTVFSLVLAATVVVSIQVLGVTLIAAALVIPPIVARLLTDSFDRLMWLSIALGAASGVTGVYASYFIDVSSGATVVLTSTLLFVAALAWTGLRGGRAALGPRARAIEGDGLFE